MTRLLILGVGMVLSVGCFAQSSPETDTMFMPNLIEVSVGATKTAKRDVPKVETPAPEPIISREEAYVRVEKCEQQASELYNKIDNYRDMLRGSNRKNLILKTTGYFKPSVLRGADEVRADANQLCKAVNQEIQKIETAQLSISERQACISRLVSIKGTISKESEKIADLMIRKLKM